MLLRAGCRPGPGLPSRVGVPVCTPWSGASPALSPGRFPLLLCPREPRASAWARRRGPWPLCARSVLTASPPLPAELKRQVESAELKNQRLKEVFQTKIQEFRKACYALTGYQVDITTEGQFRLTSMYAERKADCLVFKVGPHEGVGSRSEGTAEPSLPQLSRDPRPRAALHSWRQPHLWGQQGGGSGVSSARAEGQGWGEPLSGQGGALGIARCAARR